MSLRKAKIKAFTIQEMIVVLLITAMVVGLAYSVLQLVQKQMGSIGSNYGKNTELNLLKRSLWIDFNTYNQAHYDAKKEILVFSNEMDSRTYAFLSSGVVKDKDTFDIRIENKSFFWETKPQATGAVDALILNTTKHYAGKNIVVFRRNIAVNHMNVD